jgi:hypothetical protein
MKYTVAIYIPNFIKIGSGIQKLTCRICGRTQTAWQSHKPTCVFLKTRNIGLKQDTIIYILKWFGFRYHEIYSLLRL